MGKGEERNGRRRGREARLTSRRRSEIGGRRGPSSLAAGGEGERRDELAGLVVRRRREIDPKRFPKRWSEWGDASAAFGDDDDKVPGPQFPHFQEPAYVLDVSRRRNLASYISHSCTPNVFVQYVVRGGENESCPHLMVFAMDAIPPMRELSIDYGIDNQQICA